MSLIRTISSGTSFRSSTRSGASSAMMAVYGSIWRTRSTINRERRGPPMLRTDPMVVLPLGGVATLSPCGSSLEFFKHYVPGVGHKSEMGVPFRFHLAMTDPEFRSFICGGQGPHWILSANRELGKINGEIRDAGGGGKCDAGTHRDRPSRNYEFLFLFSKQPNYYFDRTAIDVPARSSYRNADRANAGSVWETRWVSDADDRPNNLWRVNPEASPYRHVAMWPRELVRQMLLPTSRPGDTVLDPFAGSGTTGEVALDLGLKVILIESSARCQEALTARLHGLSRSLAL